MFIRSTTRLKALSLFILTVFASSTIAGDAFAAVAGLPVPGTMVMTSQAYSMPVLKALKIDVKNPFNLDFIIDSSSAQKVSKEEASRLVNYFLAALAVDKKDIWVNLSPYEQERITDPNLAITDLGKDLLKQDYILKQLSASLTHPETETGKSYWNNGSANSDMSKIWIVPEQANVYEADNTAYITNLTFNVETESQVNASSALNGILAQVRQEVNTGENFSNLRQIFHSIVLAEWFKAKLKDSVFKHYINQNKVEGIDIEDKTAKDKIWAQYVESFQKGAYNTVTKVKDSYSGRIQKQKFFAGGVTSSSLTVADETDRNKVKLSGQAFQLGIELTDPNQDVSYANSSSSNALTYGSLEEVANNAFKFRKALDDNISADFRNFLGENHQELMIQWMKIADISILEKLIQLAQKLYDNNYATADTETIAEMNYKLHDETNMALMGEGVALELASSSVESESDRNKLREAQILVKLGNNQNRVDFLKRFHPEVWDKWMNIKVSSFLNFVTVHFNRLYNDINFSDEESVVFYGNSTELTEELTKITDLAVIVDDQEPQGSSALVQTTLNNISTIYDTVDYDAFNYLNDNHEDLMIYWSMLRNPERVRMLAHLAKDLGTLLKRKFGPEHIKNQMAILIDTTEEFLNEERELLDQDLDFEMLLTNDAEEQLVNGGIDAETLNIETEAISSSIEFEAFDPTNFKGFSFIITKFEESDAPTLLASL